MVVMCAVWEAGALCEALVVGTDLPVNGLRKHPGRNEFYRSSHEYWANSGNNRVVNLIRAWAGHMRTNGGGLWSGLQLERTCAILVILLSINMHLVQFSDFEADLHRIFSLWRPCF